MCASISRLARLEHFTSICYAERKSIRRRKREKNRRESIEFGQNSCTLFTNAMDCYGVWLANERLFLSCNCILVQLLSKPNTFFWFPLIFFTFQSVPFDWKFLIHSPTNFSYKEVIQWYEWIDIGWIKLKSLWVYTCFWVPKNALCTVHIPGNWWMNLRLSTFSMKVTKPSKLHRNRISLCCHSTASKWSSHGEKEWNKIISCVLSLRKQLSPTAGTRIFQQCAYQEYSINGLAVCFKCGDAKMHVYWWRR